MGGRWWLSSLESAGALRPLITPQHNNTIALICVARHSRHGRESLPPTWEAMSKFKIQIQPIRPADFRQKTVHRPQHRASAVLFYFRCFMRVDRVNQGRSNHSGEKLMTRKKIQLIFGQSGTVHTVITTFLRGKFSLLADFSVLSWVLFCFCNQNERRRNLKPRLLLNRQTLDTRLKGSFLRITDRLSHSQVSGK